MCKPSPKKFRCKPTPEFLIGEVSAQTHYRTDVLTCALDKAQYCDGNHILYTTGRDRTHRFIQLDLVDGESCKPKPEACHCKTLLEKVLKKVLEDNPETNRIDGHFAAIPFMAGCRCYLGVSAKQGFNYMESVPTGRIDFTKDNYGEVCERLEKDNNFSKEIEAHIHKEEDKKV